MRALPLDPGQALTVRAKGRCSIEISALSQQMAFTVRDIEGDQAMGVVILFDRQNLAIGEAQITVAFAAVAESLGHAGIEPLAIYLLISLIDEQHGVVAQAERPAAIFVDPTAHAETVWRQAVRLALLPAPDATGRIFRSVFVPEQAGRADRQLCEINARRHRLRGT